MSSQRVLELRDVSVRRGDRTILGPLNFAIAEGERWVVLGPNGAGKSTLLQILATRIFPTHGVVKVLDKEMGRVDLWELRNRIGICGTLISEDIPYGEKVRDVVLTAAYAVLGRWNEAYDLWDESRAVALLTTFGVRDMADRDYGTLSDGEKKRVQISRALMADPELLLLDEPTAGLDPYNTKRICDMMLRLKADGASAIFVTHDMPSLFAVCDRIAVLRDGRIHAIGTRDEIEKTDSWVGRFIEGEEL
jgi:iron complex transport system ATP-binding protein